MGATVKIFDRGLLRGYQVEVAHNGRTVTAHAWTRPAAERLALAAMAELKATGRFTLSGITITE